MQRAVLLHQAGEQAIVAGDTQQAEAHHQHSGDGAAAERHRKRGIQAVVGGFGGADVGAHRHVHADVASQTGEHCTDQETEGRGPVEGDAE